MGGLRAGRRRCLRRVARPARASLAQGVVSAPASAARNRRGARPQHGRRSRAARRPRRRARPGRTRGSGRAPASSSIIPRTWRARRSSRRSTRRRSAPSTGSAISSARRGAASPDRALSVDGHVFFPHSLGMLYLAVTQYLGFPSYGDEFKVMGLAPYGEPRFTREIESLVHLGARRAVRARPVVLPPRVRRRADDVGGRRADDRHRVHAEARIAPRSGAPARPAGRRPSRSAGGIAPGGLRAGGDARAAARAEGDRQHQALPRRRLRDEQRRQRQDPRGDGISRRVHAAGRRRQRHGARRRVLRAAISSAASRAAS